MVHHAFFACTVLSHSCRCHIPESRQCPVLDVQSFSEDEPKMIQDGIPLIENELKRFMMGPRAPPRVAGWGQEPPPGTNIALRWPKWSRCWAQDGPEYKRTCLGGIVHTSSAVRKWKRSSFGSRNHSVCNLICLVLVRSCAIARAQKEVLLAIQAVATQPPHSRHTVATVKYRVAWHSRV